MLQVQVPPVLGMRLLKHVVHEVVEVQTLHPAAQLTQALAYPEPGVLSQF